MPCVALPIPQLPPLPLPFGIPKLVPPGPPGLPNICCKLPPIPAFKPNVKLPPLNPAVVATIRAGIKALQAYLRAVPLKCPREG